MKYAVVRETRYALRTPVQETREFREFQREHARLEGYRGTVVVEAGEGWYLTVTLWESAEEMTAARERMGPVVERTIGPLWSAPADLVATGPVVVDDLSPDS